MTERVPGDGGGRWQQVNTCPECGADMERAAQVGEQIGLYYRCAEHGRFHYSWDTDTIERVPDHQARAAAPGAGKTTEDK
jgi:hypothetical protein